MARKTISPQHFDRESMGTTPWADGGVADAESARDNRIARFLGAGQHHAGAEGEALEASEAGRP
jgi:hypothetical protein